MHRTRTAMGVGLLISGFLATIVGLWMLISLPMSSLYGLLTLVIGIIFIVIGSLSKKEIKEESEKPVMSITAESS